MKLKKNESFFDEVSLFYDGMTGFTEALKRREAVINKFIEEGMKNVADFGCGSGLDSISLSQNGLKVTAFDQSEGMISQARNNALKAGVQISFRKKSLDKIPVSFASKFDLVLSLGNTLANLDKAKLSMAVHNMYNILRPKGRAVIQILNYTVLQSRGERIINITTHDTSVYVRFYDLPGDQLNFNILKFNKENPSDRILHSTTLFPHTRKDLVDLMKFAGFRDIKVYGSLKLEKFSANSSADLVIIVRK
ncbi:MAG: methyltransferase domain-containing protein [Ignavibacteria bacterium]